jgi:hypothetical protein
MIIAELSKRDSNVDVMDLKIYEEADDLPKDEINNYLNELRSLDLIGRRGRNMKVSGTDFSSIFYITKEGIIESNQGEEEELR